MTRISAWLAPDGATGPYSTSYEKPYNHPLPLITHRRLRRHRVARLGLAIVPLCQLTDDDDIAARRSQLIGQINGLFCNFSKVDPMTRNRLFQVYCSSFYGCQIWDLCNIKSVEDFCITWRKGMRRVWSLPAVRKMMRCT